MRIETPPPSQNGFLSQPERYGVALSNPKNWRISDKAHGLGLKSPHQIPPWRQIVWPKTGLAWAKIDLITGWTAISPGPTVKSTRKNSSLKLLRENRYVDLPKVQRTLGRPI
jgi:hypothetical protein